jgi:hypothetical protein
LPKSNPKKSIFGKHGEKIKKTHQIGLFRVVIMSKTY